MMTLPHMTLKRAVEGLIVHERDQETTGGQMCGLQNA